MSVELLHFNACHPRYLPRICEDWHAFGRHVPSYLEILDAVDEGKILGYAVMVDGQYAGMLALELLPEAHSVNVAAIRLRPNAPAPAVHDAMERIALELGADYAIVAMSPRTGMERYLSRYGWKATEIAGNTVFTYHPNNAAEGV